jgi:hypothetical protein
MSSQTYRPKFFEGQYLGASDLSAIVEHDRISDARHLLGAHTWGIAIGLQVKPVPQPDGSLQMSVQPGYAWDGFGRPIVVLAPAPISPALFRTIGYNAALDEPAGRLVPVWIRYREAATREPAPGFELCRDIDQTSRIQETFAIEAGDRAPDEQQSNIVVFGREIPASQVFRAFDPADPVLHDASVPQQEFPEADRTSRWLLPVGYVRWKPGATPLQAGTFQPLSAADIAAGKALRIMVGVVASAVQAPDGVLRLKDRSKPPSGVASQDLAWVEGNLRVEGDARLFGGKLSLLDAQGLDQGVPMTLQRGGDNSGTGRQLRAEIGTAQAGSNSLQVGPTVAGTFTPVLSVLDNGAVGVGTSAAGGRLEVTGGDLIMKAIAEDAGDLIFQNSTGVPKGRVWSNPAAGPALFLSSGDNTPDLTIDGNGLVGVGTTTPDRAVTVAAPAGVTGAYLNIKAGGREVLVGVDGNGGILSSMSNDDLQLRSGINSTKMVVKADGRIGVGTLTPERQLHVFGDRIRLQNGGKFLDLRADGSAVDLHSETNNVYIRASGAGGNNKIVMNPFPGDGEVGIGTQTPRCQLHVAGTINAPASSPEGHVALVDNQSPGTGASVLALRIGAAVPHAGHNFITFFAGNAACGRIEGNGAGAVTYRTSGSDFAECLPHLDVTETIEAGDVVGIVHGAVTRRTTGAQHVSVITDRPAVLGNAPIADDRPVGQVAMLGQVPVKVRGHVNAGDLIVASGADDGCGRAVSAEDAVDLDPTMLIGTAWESCSHAGVNRINVAIGLSDLAARVQQAELQRLRRRIAQLERKGD